MGKNTKLATITSLIRWYETRKRTLPWRENRDPYRVWVSEIMLQQTRVEAVIPFFNAWIKRFPNVRALALAKEEEVLAHWQGLGYYSRARNLQKASMKVVELGRFPKTREEWLDLPGVGLYTAGAILSISQGKHEASVDGNIARVFSRLNRDPTVSSVSPSAWARAAEWMKLAHRARLDPGTLTQAWMELGARVCTPRSPKCSECPIQKFCEAFREGDQECFPTPKEKPVKKKITETRVFLRDQDGKVLLKKAGAGEWRAGLWDLPSDLPTGLIPPSAPTTTVTTRHVVTNHEITRMTRVYPSIKVVKKIKIPERCTWVKVGDPAHPFGSALRTTLKAIGESLDAQSAD